MNWNSVRNCLYYVHCPVHVGRKWLVAAVDMAADMAAVIASAGFGWWSFSVVLPTPYPVQCPYRSRTAPIPILRAENRDPTYGVNTLLIFDMRTVSTW